MTSTLASLTLITGGARSGKSRHALSLMDHQQPVTYIATAEALDEDMRGRIALHRAERPAAWRTVEAPVALADAVRLAPADEGVIVDCLTLWVSNLLLRAPEPAVTAPEPWYPAQEVEDLLGALSSRRGPVVVVTNEVGLGVVPATTLGRAYRDALGRVNQRVADAAGVVLFMISGLPMVVKDVGRKTIGPSS
jgi:adenosylcobinamide kinase/adenosylcobinamide-phosphate guanylyltransferase